MNSIDERFSWVSLIFLFLSLNLLSIYAASVWMVGIYALIPGLILFALGGTLGFVFMKCQVSVKRELRQAVSCPFQRTLLILFFYTAMPRLL